MEKVDIDFIDSREEYDFIRMKREEVIKEAQEKGMFNVSKSNEYTREICRLSQLINEYEDRTMPELKEQYEKMQADIKARRKKTYKLIFLSILMKVVFYLVLIFLAIFLYRLIF